MQEPAVEEISKRRKCVHFYNKTCIRKKRIALAESVCLSAWPVIGTAI
jgi:hypothetical protein